MSSPRVLDNNDLFRILRYDARKHPKRYVAELVGEVWLINHDVVRRWHQHQMAVLLGCPALDSVREMPSVITPLPSVSFG
jgi:hypothetical protein